MWDLWINCTKCCWCKWNRVGRAVEPGQSCCRGTSNCTYATCRDTKLLAGTPVLEFPPGMYGLCLCYLLAFSLQCALLIVRGRYFLSPGFDYGSEGDEHHGLSTAAVTILYQSRRFPHLLAVDSCIRAWTLWFIDLCYIIVDFIHKIK